MAILVYSIKTNKENQAEEELAAKAWQQPIINAVANSEK